MAKLKLNSSAGVDLMFSDSFYVLIQVNKAGFVENIDILSNNSDLIHWQHLISFRRLEASRRTLYCRNVLLNTFYFN